MGSEEVNFEAVLQEKSDDLQDFDDAAETLSLCDLPLNGSSSDWDDFSRKEQSSSFDQDFFEFFSEDFSTSSNYQTDNIIFCGKLIHSKGEARAEEAQNIGTSESGKKRRKFQWKLLSFNKSSSLKRVQDKSEQSCKTLSVASLENINRRATKKSADRSIEKYDSSMKKVSILATPMKSRWYLFAFGVGKFPMEMDLSDMKNRQSRRSPAKMFQSDDGSQMVSRSSVKRAKGLWGLLKVLGCKSLHATAVVKASFGCIPSV